MGGGARLVRHHEQAELVHQLGLDQVAVERLVAHETRPLLVEGRAGQGQGEPREAHCRTNQGDGSKRGSITRLAPPPGGQAE